MRKHIFALLLSVIMCFSFVSTAFATEYEWVRNEDGFLVQRPIKDDNDPPKDDDDDKKPGGDVTTPTNPGTPTTPRYTVTSPSKPENGSVKLSTTYAQRGETVTITATPDEGYRLPKYSNGVTVTDARGRSVALTETGDGRYTFKMPDSRVTVDVAFVPVMNFIDVSAGDWFADAAEWGSELGIVVGLPGMSFGPGEPCKRAEIVTFLWRAAGQPKVNIEMPFTDVDEGLWYSEAVKWAYSKGIVMGLTDTTFGPGETCTRAQALTFLYRYEGKPRVSASGKFTDVDMSDGSFYKDAVLWAVKEEITQGMTDTAFGPGVNCTRGHVVTWMFRDMVD